MGKAAGEKTARAPHFELRFVGDVHPESLPMTVLSDALQAVQRLSGAGATGGVSHEDRISLLRVRRGSATFQCHAWRPEQAIGNLQFAGELLHNADIAGDRPFEHLLKPLKTLSEVSGTVGAKLQIRSVEGDRQLLAEIEADSFQRLLKSLIVTGETTLTGRVVRVGGATGLKCSLRLEEESKLVYCKVRSRATAQQLGQQLYSFVAVTGIAHWLQKRWSLYRFEIHSMQELRRGTIKDALRALRAAGGDAWDEVDDPEALVRGTSK